MQDVISKLVEALSDSASIRGLIPGWENPAHRFYRDAVKSIWSNSAEIPGLPIFELLLHGKDDEFLLWLAGESHSKQELLSRIEPFLVQDPDRIKNWVGDEG
jgi:hypothetical protein